MLSQNPARYRRALQVAHDEIRKEGLDELLPDIMRDTIINTLD